MKDAFFDAIRANQLARASFINDDVFMGRGGDFDPFYNEIEAVRNGSRLLSKKSEELCRASCPEVLKKFQPDEGFNANEDTYTYVEALVINVINKAGVIEADVLMNYMGISGLRFKLRDRIVSAQESG